MKKYEDPKILIIRLAAEDIITESEPGYDGDESEIE